MIVINISKAKEITKDKIRVYRKPLLEQLDLQFMQNLSNASVLSEIEVKKQELRDMPSTVDAYETIDDLTLLVKSLEGVEP